MLPTYIFLKTKYRFRNVAGVIVCVAGLVMVVFSDVHAGDRSDDWFHNAQSLIAYLRYVGYRNPYFCLPREG
ncbi:hypothetical protein V6N12_027629 [Hibiscus sabdariffa]|uniref:Mannosyltransferase n=1 Tax=Hibiscus sabdariffa TaxID=183260 RepID=A0ABR2F3H3_9ROSI